jgi:3-oxoacyl-[acyl-carrier-protein] synthase-3
MTMAGPVYVTAMGKFLPGAPVGNDQVEDHIGRVGGKASRLRARILRQNGIRTRHYATPRDGEAPLWNHDLAARAVSDALARGPVAAGDVELLAAATSQGDLLAPGFASMVHGALRLPPCEIASLHGVCSSGVMALQAAYRAVAAGHKANAVAVASELASRFFRPHLFEATREFRETGRISFEAEFLRFMLSDGAGAAVLENRPAERGLSLRVEWIDLVSYADRLDVCMYAGARKDDGGALVRSWHEYPGVCEAARDGALLLMQDVGLLDNIVTLGVGRYFELVQQGRIRPSEVDWLACHYSSHVFRGRILELLQEGGAAIPEERWFTNLYTKGNTGSASIYIMLEELLNDGHLRPGQKVLCMVPESGRFVVSFMMLTVVGEAKAPVDDVLPAAPAPPLPAQQGDDLRAVLTRQLATVWVEFETSLRRVPIVDKIHRRTLRTEDYRLLLLNLRQQVVEGARWIARAASSLTRDELGLRSEFIRHAAEEHRDYQMLEKDFVSVGGMLPEIQEAEKNVGSEALSAWMLHRASQENPLDLLGAMFVIEGLGTRVAGPWARAIQGQLGLRDDQVSFLRYHGANDERHFERLHHALEGGRLTPALVARIVKTARVTARLYRLQLEELGNC